MQRNIYVVLAACLSFLVFMGEALGHHNPNHKVLLLDRWVDAGTARGWFCRSEVPILHSMRLWLKEGLDSASYEALLESYYTIPNEQGEPTCDKDVFQIKPVRILAQKSLPQPKKGVATAIEFEVEGRAPLYTLVWLPVLKPEDDPRTFFVGSSTKLTNFWICDTKKQADDILAGYRESDTEGVARYRTYNARRNTQDNPVCGSVSGWVNITDIYKTAKIPRSEIFSQHPTVFRLEIQGKPYFSWTYGAIVGHPKPKVPEHKI